MGAAEGGREELDLRRWLATQKAYQLSAFGLDWDAIGDDPEALTQYVTTMLNAAFLEVAEAQAETPWKPWAKADKAAVWAANRDKVIGECVDVLFFIANVLGAAGCSDEELAKRYAAKMRVNERRQETGYDGVSGKCVECGRALDDPGMTPVHNAVGTATWCGVSCQRDGDRKNRDTLRGIGFSDARINAMIAKRDGRPA